MLANYKVDNILGAFVGMCSHIYSLEVWHQNVAKCHEKLGNIAT